MERRSVIINETVLVCLELFTIFLSITLAQLKKPMVKTVYLGDILGVPITAKYLPGLITTNPSKTPYHQLLLSRYNHVLIVWIAKNFELTVKTEKHRMETSPNIMLFGTWHQRNN